VFTFKVGFHLFSTLHSPGAAASEFTTFPVFYFVHDLRSRAASTAQAQQNCHYRAFSNFVFINNRHPTDDIARKLDTAAATEKAIVAGTLFHRLSIAARSTAVHVCTAPHGTFVTATTDAMLPLIISSWI